MIEKIQSVIFLTIVLVVFFSVPIVGAIITYIFVVLLFYQDNQNNIKQKNKDILWTVLNESNDIYVNTKNFEKSVIETPSEIIEYLKYNNINYLWHFTHIINLLSIQQHGILPLYELKMKNIISIYGGNELSHKLDEKRKLDRWIHLSFTNEHPMYYIKKNHWKNLVWLKIDLSILKEKEFLFSKTIANKNQSTFSKNIKTINIKDMVSNDFYTKKEANKAEILIKGTIEPKYILNMNELLSQMSYKIELIQNLQKIRKKIENELKIEKSTLLRDEILEILVYEEITNRNEFLLKVPLYLREKIKPKEANFLPEIFENIQTYMKNT